MGLSARIWRQSSEPIDPPAPVTITFLLVIQFARSFWFGSIISRTNKSEISRSRTSLIVAFLEVISSSEGIVLTDTLLFAKIKIREIPIPTIYAGQISHLKGIKYSYNVIKITLFAMLHRLKILKIDKGTLKKGADPDLCVFD